VFACPSCGLSEKYETILRELGEWVEDVGGHALQESVSRAIRGNKAIKFEPSKLPKRKHRFVLIQDD
jgi:hypothetical protein